MLNLNKPYKPSNPEPPPPQLQQTAPRYLSAPKICHNPYCGFQTHERINRCPECRRPMWTTNEFRLISALLIPCGLFFVAVGGGLIFAVAYSVSKSGADSFKGGEMTVYFLYALFGLIFALGLSVGAAGVWQVIIGKPNVRLIGIFLSLIVIVFTVAFLLRFIIILISD